VRRRSEAVGGGGGRGGAEETRPTMMMVAQRNGGKKSGENWHSFPRVCRRTDSCSLNTLCHECVDGQTEELKMAGRTIARNGGKNVAMTLARRMQHNMHPSGRHGGTRHPY
jgi:hypothetical protein